MGEIMEARGQGQCCWGAILTLVCLFSSQCLPIYSPTPSSGITSTHHILADFVWFCFKILNFIYFYLSFLRQGFSM